MRCVYEGEIENGTNSVKFGNCNKIFDYTFPLVFMRGNEYVQRKRLPLCKAAHHLFISLTHVTFRDNT